MVLDRFEYPPVIRAQGVTGAACSRPDAGCVADGADGKLELVTRLDRPGVPSRQGDVVGGQFDLNWMLVQTWGMSSRSPRTGYPVAQWAELTDLLAVVVTASLIAIIYLDRVGVARTVLALGFTFFVPGRAIVSNWPRMARWSEAAMPMIISLTITTLVATVALWAHFWHPLPIFEAEAWLSLAGLVVGITRRRRLGLVGSGYAEETEYPGQRQNRPGEGPA